MSKWTLARFIKTEIEPYLAEFKFLKSGSEFQIQSSDGVLGWLDFRSKRTQTETVTFFAEAQVTIPAFLPEELRSQLPLPGPKVKLGAKGFMSTAMKVPVGYQSLLINPRMASSGDLFSFFEDGGAVDECAAAFRDSWVTQTWPWFQERLSLESLAQLRYAPRLEIEQMMAARQSDKS